MWFFRAVVIMCPTVHSNSGIEMFIETYHNICFIAIYTGKFSYIAVEVWSSISSILFSAKNGDLNTVIFKSDFPYHLLPCKEFLPDSD